MDQLTYQVLLRLNPWIINLENWPHCIQKFLPEPFVPRLAELIADKNQVSLVIGPRQSGKTTFIRQFLSRQPEPYFYLNCEEPSVRELCNAPALFLDQMEGIGPKTGGFFF